MLGMVNHALQEMVVLRYGQTVWESICVDAQVDEPVFGVMRQYPDDVTFRLAAAIARALDVPVAEALRQFGQYWMIYAEKQPWGKVMRSMGSSVRELLPALDALHARIALSFPGVDMPQFRSEPLDDGSLRIHYFSSRSGLGPFVGGALEGIGLMYGENVKVAQVEFREQGAAHDVFLVQFLESELQ